ncbi:hypothetical protein BJV77DRAFT_1031048 [Russula vinacea]|nr:hypothetical protein BJV77DRAFT_1031048 [Russula vinacea]
MKTRSSQPLRYLGSVSHPLMKRRGERGLGGGWDRMRGVKRVQIMCKTMGSRRMRREEAARQNDSPGTMTQRPVLRSSLNPRDLGSNMAGVLTVLSDAVGGRSLLRDASDNPHLFIFSQSHTRGPMRLQGLALAPSQVAVPTASSIAVLSPFLVYTRDRCSYDR